MSRLLKYLTSFETKGATALPLNSETHDPITPHEHPLGPSSKGFMRWWNILTSGHGHATPLYYWAVALVLGLITVVEIWVPGLNITRGTLITTVLLLGLFKFILVAALYMHLRFDHRSYSWVFVVCMVLGVAIFVALLALTQFFGAGRPA